MTPSRQIPDLRAKPEITLEHCYVLLTKTSEALALIHGFDPKHPEYKEALEDFSDVNPELLLNVYEEVMEPHEFSHLFKTDFGKNILVGMFLQTLLQRVVEEEV